MERESSSTTQVIIFNRTSGLIIILFQPTTPKNKRSIQVQGLEQDHGQTDSRARAQQLSAAHHKVTLSIPIGFKYSTARGKQRLPVCKGKGHCKHNVSVLRK